MKTDALQSGVTAALRNSALKKRKKERNTHLFAHDLDSTDPLKESLAPHPDLGWIGHDY